MIAAGYLAWKRLFVFTVRVIKRGTQEAKRGEELNCIITSAAEGLRPESMRQSRGRRKYISLVRVRVTG